MGSAILAAVGAGVSEGIEDAVDAMVRTTAVYEPNPELTERYERAFQIFRKAYHGLAESGLCSELAKFRFEYSND